MCWTLERKWSTQGELAYSRREPSNSTQEDPAWESRTFLFQGINAISWATVQPGVVIREEKTVNILAYMVSVAEAVYITINTPWWGCFSKQKPGYFSELKGKLLKLSTRQYLEENSRLGWRLWILFKGSLLYVHIITLYIYHIPFLSLTIMYVCWS